MAQSTYLGFDLSTQQLKAVVIQSNLKLVNEAKVDFDADFGNKYGIHKGVIANPSEGEIYTPTALWLEALDLVLQRLKEHGVDFSTVKGVSGAGMQHGTVFWSQDAEALLGGLDAKKSLHEQLVPAEDGKKSVFSHPHSPNWQDASTQKQCEAFDKELGDEQTLADVTGSKAHHRFSGPQIMRFREKHPDHYEATSRISLVSSFLASLLLGSIAPIDISDVCGANLWDIPSGAWHKQLLTLAAGGSSGLPALQKKLGSVSQDGGEHLGKISPYFTHRYGFDPSCTVAPFTGDNPSTILSLPLRAGDAMVSLGTSTTFLMSTQEYKPHPSYHFMNHPTTKGLYMFMLCYKNGALAREQVRDALNAQHANDAATWDAFNEAALHTPPLAQPTPSDPMHLALYFPRPEIVPALPAGEWHYTYHPSTQTPLTFDTSPQHHHGPADARLILESQFLSLRLRSAPLVHAQAPSSASSSSSSSSSTAPLPPQPRRIYLVGGGSQNPTIARLAGEILGGLEGVYRLDIGGNACALGAAYKSVWSVEAAGRGEAAGWESFEEFVGARWCEEDFVERVDRGYRSGVWEVYGEAVKGFEMMEEQVARDVGGRVAKGERGEMGSAVTREKDG